MKARSQPSPGKKAKPNSMVMPRNFSSGKRSGSVPVSARTKLLLPWSTWPAVPITTCGGAQRKADDVERRTSATGNASAGGAFNGSGERGDFVICHSA